MKRFIIVSIKPHRRLRISAHETREKAEEHLASIRTTMASHGLPFTYELVDWEGHPDDWDDEAQQ